MRNRENWILNDVTNQINVYADVSDVKVNLEKDEIVTGVKKIKEEMEARNTWMWDFASKIGILTAIWA